MSILNNSLLLGADAGGYQISRSLRFNSADSAYLSRTPASAGNRKTWTWSGWVKRSALGPAAIFCATRATSTRPTFEITFGAGDILALSQYNGSGYDIGVDTLAAFRDLSAWYHLVVALDTTQATATNRAKIYVNGALQATSGGWPALNADLEINNNVPTDFGRNNWIGTTYFNGYLADVHFIDGQALTPSSFAETNATTGQWVPKAYTGSYGTNGFRLDFSDNSAATATTLGKDRAGSNNWTPNNLSVTAGAGNDSLVDTPTSYGTDTGAGGQVRGNYCTWNPLSAGNTTLSNGNLSSVTSNQAGACGTIQFPPSNKWFFDLTFSIAGTSNNHIGIIKSNPTVAMLATTANTDAVLYRGDGNIFRNTGGGYSVVQTVSSYTSGDVIGVAVNNDASTIQFYKNGSTVGTAINLTAATEYTPFIHHGGGQSGGDANFGQRPFAYTAPSGFKALCDTNLPAPVVAKPSTVMDVVTYTGTGASRSITGLNFSPDWVWIKSRSNGAYHHRLVDTVRGATKEIYSNLTNAEGTDSVGLTAFNSDGFTLGSSNEYNASGQTFVGWTWDAGSSTVTNTSGSISSQVRANASAGFSIVTYTGNGSTGATVGHGLGVSLGMVIVKRRNAAGDHWPVWHTSLGNNAGAYLDLTNASYSSSAHVQSVTSTTFIVGTDTDANASGGTYVAYCFAPVAGYSAFGSYTGNGSTDGPFVYTGFRPRWVMVKRSDAAYEWWVFDTARNTFNVVDKYISPNSSASEYTFNILDINANGFKLRDGSQGWNGSSGTIIYAAFAESPFAYSRAR